MKYQAAALILTAAFSSSAGAASSFTPNNQPFGHIAPVMLSTPNIAAGGAYVYRPWFDNLDFHGDLKAYSVTSSGAVNATPAWSAKTQLDAMSYSARKVVTYDGSNAVSYGCESGTSTNLVKYVCGDTSQAGTRARTSVLGDIVHAQPAYVGAPSKGYPFDGYLKFADDNANRAGMLYVSANDGMLHGLNASTGNEVFAYIPSQVTSNLALLDNDPYVHQYFVDGPLVVADAYADYDGDASSEWKTVLVGGLGAGGKGYFALDVTSPTATTLTDAQNKFLWEFSDSNLGYTYAKPVVTRLNTGQWGVVIANGYMNNGDYKARLYILDITDGTIIKQLVLDKASAPSTSSSPNGLSSPAVIDTDGDYKADLIYAGDLDGNLWKIDISDASASNWSVGLSGAPLFTAQDSSNNPQSITTAPDVADHPKGGYLIYVGTGQALSASSLTSATHQSLFGVWDNSQSSTLTPANLQLQQLQSITGQSNYRSVTANAVDWSSSKGWKINLSAGEAVLQEPQVHDSRLQMMISDTSSTPPAHWLTQVDHLTGGLPADGVYDLNGDGDIDATDNPDYIDSNNTGTRAVAIKKSAALASRPVIARGDDVDHAYVNLWVEQEPPAAASCSMLYVDLRYTYSMDKIPTWKNPSDHSQGVNETNGVNGSYDITFTGYLDNGSTIDVKLSNLQYRNNAKYNIADCNNTNGCTHGVGGNNSTTEIDMNLFSSSDGALFTTSNGRGNTNYADGLSFDFSGTDLHRSNRSFDFGIQFESVYKLAHFAFDFDFTPASGANVVTNSVERVEAEMMACNQYGSSGISDNDTRVIKDGVVETTDAAFTWDTSTQSLDIDNKSNMIFNAAGEDTSGGIDVNQGEIDDDGSSDKTDQDDSSSLMGRVLWRELLF